MTSVLFPYLVFIWCWYILHLPYMFRFIRIYTDYTVSPHLPYNVIIAPRLPIWCAALPETLCCDWVQSPFYAGVVFSPIFREFLSFFFFLLFFVAPYSRYRHHVITPIAPNGRVLMFIYRSASSFPNPRRNIDPDPKYHKSAYP